MQSAAYFCRTIALVSICLGCSIADLRHQKKEFDEKAPGPIGTNVTTLRSETILAELNYEGSTISKCRLTPLLDESESEKELPMFPGMKNITNEEMLTYVFICGDITTRVLKESSLSQMFYIAKKIVPGTLWCGPGTISPAYEFLGPQTETDRCCRNHDFCPVFIPPNSHRYGYKEDHEYSILTCDCDIEFAKCLNRNTENEPFAAKLTQSIYFKMYDGTCFKLDNGKMQSFSIKEMVPERFII